MAGRRGQRERERVKLAGTADEGVVLSFPLFHGAHFFIETFQRVSGDSVEPPVALEPLPRGRGPTAPPTTPHKGPS